MCAEALTRTVNQLIDGLRRFVRRFVSKDLIEQCVPREKAAGPPHQLSDEPKLGGGQPDIAPVNRQSPSREVERDGTMHEEFRGVGHDSPPFDVIRTRQRCASAGGATDESDVSNRSSRPPSDPNSAR